MIARAAVGAVLLQCLGGIAGSYDWPVQPFTAQHSVRSVLDEYREPVGNTPERFHDGIDIDDATTGTNVYSIVSGFATVNEPQHWIRVGNYCYCHVDPCITPPFYVKEFFTVIGTIDGENHLHFIEGQPNAEINPLRQGGIFPFNDNLSPNIDEAEIRFYTDGTWDELNPGYDPSDPDCGLTGKVDIVAKAWDAITGGGSNAGIYAIGYQILDGFGNYMGFPEIVSYQFDSWLPNGSVDWVYSPSATNSDF